MITASKRKTSRFEIFIKYKILLQFRKSDMDSNNCNSPSPPSGFSMDIIKPPTKGKNLMLRENVVMRCIKFINEEEFYTETQTIAIPCMQRLQNRVANLVPLVQIHLSFLFLGPSWTMTILLTRGTGRRGSACRVPSHCRHAWSTGASGRGIPWSRSPDSPSDPPPPSARRSSCPPA